MIEVTRRSLALPLRVDRAAIHWDYVSSFLLLHALALLVFVPYFFSWPGVGAFFLGVMVFGQLGIPICYHRQLTHRSFTTPKWLEHFFVVMALCSAQETPAKWVAWHRKHHRLSDEQEDPHSPLVSFLWAHTGWLCRPNRSMTDVWFYQKYARDILDDPFYFYLERKRTAMIWIYLAHALLYFLVAGAVAWLLMPDGAAALQMALSLFVWGVAARTVYVWHITWSVNSLSHLFGYRNYDTSDDSRNNWFVALITGGEGWHNNHHADQAAATVQHRWWELDLSFYFIKLLEWVGLATRVVPTRQKRQVHLAKYGLADAPTGDYQLDEDVPAEDASEELQETAVL
jgi:stearoyl-CoA desaturase (delta-9 desaturase)